MAGRILLLIVAVLVATVGCVDTSRPPSRQPDVTGVADRSALDATVLTDASDSYYEGMELHGRLYLDDDTGARTADVDGLGPGTPVAVWVGGACAESSPVQCEIEAVQVLE